MFPGRRYPWVVGHPPPEPLGPKSLEQKGVSEEQIRRLGHPHQQNYKPPWYSLQKLTRPRYSLYIGKWRIETVHSCYLSSISREACRAQAGFEKEVW
jgi:hypothetical protein